MDLVDAVYLISIVADQPRSIDRYIDYFGGGAEDVGGDRRHMSAPVARS
jgi:hypothetical protein